MVKNLVEGQGLENTYELLLKYQRDLSINKLTEEAILTFFKKWVKLKSKTNKIKPYALNNMNYYLLKVVNDRNLLTNKYSIFKSKLKKLTNKMAKKLFSKKLQETKRADIFSMSEIDEISDALWLGNAMSKAASVKLKITFMTGCRSGDLNSCYWRDIKRIKNKGDIFYSIPMRYSKTNPRSLKKEYITIRESNDSRWSILNLLTKYNKYLVETGQFKSRIFPDKPTRAFVYYYEKVAKKLGYLKRLTGHSGRNSTLVRLFEANVSTEDICIQYHWKRSSEMVFHYRNILLETTKLGAPYALSKYDEACNFK
jgi:hypothetical protein